MIIPCYRNEEAGAQEIPGALQPFYGRPVLRIQLVAPFVKFYLRSPFLQAAAGFSQIIETKVGRSEGEEIWLQLGIRSE